MGPSVRLLRYFVAVAETGTFTRAAAQLHVSQPALSQQIRKLEHELGFPLFHRGARATALTAQGQQLLNSAKVVIAAATAYERLARDLGHGAHRLVIGYRAAHELIRRLVTAFHAEHAEVEVTLRQYPMSTTHAGIDTGEVDLAVLRLPVDLSGLDHLTLTREPRVALLPAGHPLARRDSIQLIDLDRLAWITTTATDAAWQRHVQPVIPGRPTAPRRIVVDTLDEFIETVSAARGTALAPASAARLYARPGLAFVQVTDAEPATIGLAWRAGATETNATIAAFVATARTLIKTIKPE